MSPECPAWPEILATGTAPPAAWIGIAANRTWSSLFASHFGVDIVEAMTLPAYTYHDYEHWHREQVQLFSRTWTNVGPITAVAHPGDVAPITVAGQPLVLTRDEAGTLHVLHNVCRHRGARVSREPCTAQRLLLCAYHHWGYGLDGRLLGTPHWKTSDHSAPAGFDAERFGLVPVRHAIWLGHIFVNLDGEAPDFDAFVAPLTERWANYDLDRLNLGLTREIPVMANWKFAIENYLDTYHLPMVHPQLGGVETARRFTDVNLAETVSGICYTTGAADKPKSSKEGARLNRHTRLNEEQLICQDILALFPNTLIEMQPHHLMVVAITPVESERSKQAMSFLFLDDDATRPELNAQREATADAWELIFSQDAEVLKDLQSGSHSQVADLSSGLSPTWEAATLSFRGNVARAMQRPS